MTNTNKNTDGEISVKCVDCGAEFAFTPIFCAGKPIMERRRCDACSAKEDARLATTESGKASAERDARWEKVCPPIYRDTDPARVNRQCIEAAMAWDVGSSAGLGMMGFTGIGKTRAAFIALRRAFDADCSCRATSHNAFTRVVQTAFSGEGREREAAKATLDGFQRCDVLLIDDVGKPPPTERADAELEELVEVRTCNLRPILWTANGSSAWLIKRMGDDRGEPLVRRLSEFSKIITIK